LVFAVNVALSYSIFWKK